MLETRNKQKDLTKIRSTSCDSDFLFPAWVAKETDVWQEKAEKLDGTDNTHTHTLCVFVCVFDTAES